jgi:hypothetical protein
MYNYSETMKLRCWLKIGAISRRKELDCKILSRQLTYSLIGCPMAEMTYKIGKVIKLVILDTLIFPMGRKWVNMRRQTEITDNR